MRGAVLTAAVVNRNQFSAKVDPAKLVPDCYREDGDGEPRREKPRTAEEEAAESEIAWRLLGMGLERS